MNSKTTLLAGAFWCLQLAVQAQSSLWLHAVDGTRLSFETNDLQTIVFQDGEAVFNLGGGISQRYPLNHISSLVFNHQASSDIRLTKAHQAARVSLTPQGLVCHFQTPGKLPVTVLTLDGRVLMQTEASCGTPLPVSHLGKGIYLIKIDGQIFKTVR